MRPHNGRDLYLGETICRIVFTTGAPRKRLPPIFGNPEMHVTRERRGNYVTNAMQAGLSIANK